MKQFDTFIVICRLVIVCFPFFSILILFSSQIKDILKKVTEFKNIYFYFYFFAVDAFLKKRNCIPLLLHINKREKKKTYISVQSQRKYSKI